MKRAFPCCSEPHYESEAKCKVFIMKISFHSHANKLISHGQPRFHNEAHVIMARCAVSNDNNISFSNNQKQDVSDVRLRQVALRYFCVIFC